MFIYYCFGHGVPGRRRFWCSDKQGSPQRARLCCLSLNYGASIRGIFSESSPRLRDWCLRREQGARYQREVTEEVTLSKRDGGAT